MIGIYTLIIKNVDISRLLTFLHILEAQGHTQIIRKINFLEAYMLELLPNYGNQKTTRGSSEIKENVSEINDMYFLYIIIKKIDQI